MKLFELIVDDIEDEIFAISLVETPAIESNFVFFDKEEVMFAKVEDEKRMVMGPVLIPDKKILRVDAQGQPYEVFFTKDTVADLASMETRFSCNNNIRKSYFNINDRY